MNDLAVFKTARPAMIVGQSFDGGPAPLGLDQPFALVGGDRLAPGELPFDLMHDHQTAALDWVASCCRTAIDTGQPWFHGSPIILDGNCGFERTLFARMLADKIDAPHVVLDIGDPRTGNALAASRRIDDAVWALPVTVAMAAHRCANPVVTVVGVGRATDDAVMGFVSLMDPNDGSCTEDQLKTTVDLSQVTWIIQEDNRARVPAFIRQFATAVRWEAFPRHLNNTATLPILLRAIRDLDLNASDPALDWLNISRRLSDRPRSAKEMYADLVRAVTAAQHGLDELPAREAQLDDVPVFLK